MCWADPPKNKKRLLGRRFFIGSERPRQDPCVGARVGLGGGCCLGELQKRPPLFLHIVGNYILFCKRNLTFQLSDRVLRRVSLVEAVRPLHGEKATARLHEGGAQLGEHRQGGHRTGDRHVKGIAKGPACHHLGTPRGRLKVCKPEPLGGGVDKAHLLGGGVHRTDAKVGAAERQGQRREARATPDIDHLRPRGNLRADGQRVNEMQQNDPLDRGHRSQVVFLIFRHQKGVKLIKGGGALRRQECRGIAPTAYRREAIAECLLFGHGSLLVVFLLIIADAGALCKAKKKKTVLLFA